MLSKNYIFSRAPLICARYYKSGLTLLLNLTVKCVLIMFLPCVVFGSRSKGVRGGIRGESQHLDKDTQTGEQLHALLTV